MPILPVAPREGVRVLATSDLVVTASPNVHGSMPNLAVRLDAGDRSLVYSSDTRPCAEVERLARGATVLVHEATFARPNSAEWHSTAREAGTIARGGGGRAGCTWPTSATRPTGRSGARGGLAGGLRRDGGDGGGAPLVSGLGLLGRLGRIGRLRRPPAAAAAPPSPGRGRRQRVAPVDPREPAGRRLPCRRGLHDPHPGPGGRRRGRAGAHQHDDRRGGQLAFPARGRWATVGLAPPAGAPRSSWAAARLSEIPREALAWHVGLGWRRSRAWPRRWAPGAPRSGGSSGRSTPSRCRSCASATRRAGTG